MKERHRARLLCGFCALLVLLIPSLVYVRYAKQTKSDALFGRSGSLTLADFKKSAAVEGKNVPIRFWGKVVDQDDKPLSSVTVKAHIRGWSFGPGGSPGGKFPTFEATSGRDGRFEINGGKGDVLTIEALEKPGYEPEPSALRSFGYKISQNITPDPNNPVVFKMWKSEIKQPMVSGDRPFHLIPDGRAYFIDLLKGTMSESASAEGDLRVWIKRRLDIPFGQRYDWSCSIQVANGGLMEETDIYSAMYVAPEQGYIAGFESSRRADERPWGDGFTKRLYVKTREGRVYGRIELDLDAFYNSQIPARIRIKYAMNPNGSRILR